MANLLELDPDVASFREAFQVSIDYVSPYWDTYIRLINLWRGQIPTQLDGTFSKVMLQIGHATVQDREPKLRENVLSEDMFHLEARDPQYEPDSERAEGWMRDLLLRPDKVNYRESIRPTMQSALVAGTGYRMPCLSHRPKDPRKPEGAHEPFITTKDVDLFQILPAANGGLVNPHDAFSADAVDWIFHVDWWTDAQIKALEKFPGYQKDNAEKLFKTVVDTDSRNSEMYHDIYNTVGGVSYSTKQDWRNRMADITGVSGRRRITHWFRRDRWMIFVQDNFKVYDGAPPLPGGLLPLAKTVTVPDFKNWFGISSLEMVEDMVIAMLMNFNYRMDYLARAMFPAKYIASSIKGNKPDSYWSDRPYAVYEVNVAPGSRISDMFHVDRMPEINSQTFIEEDRLRTFKQEIEGMPNYSKGMGGGGTLANDTATGITSLIKQAEGRLLVESETFELGMIDELTLLLVLADKNITTPQSVRRPNSKSGFPWSTVDPEIIGNFYNVRMNGTLYRAEKESKFQKALALYPYFQGSPNWDPAKLDAALVDLAGIAGFDRAMATPEPVQQFADQQGLASGSAPQPGGLASSQDITQQSRNVNRRNTVEANTGRTVPANQPL